MKRRTLLTLLGKSTIASVAWSAGEIRTQCMSIICPVAWPAAERSSNTVETQLQAYMAATETRQYSEEGVPMIVACEDLTSEAPVPPVYSKAMNDALAPMYQACVATWTRLQPNAPVVDAGKLLEFLSARHFMDGGKGGVL